MPEMELPPRRERVTASRTIYEGRILKLREDTVLLPSGAEARREIVEHAPVVAIVPLDEGNRVLMVRQFRLPAQDVLLEIPAGGVDPGEEVRAAAQRELREETGYRAQHLRKIAGFYVSPGYVTEFIHVFLATGLTHDPQEADADEDIVVQPVPLAEAVRMVEGGQVRDAKSIVGILLAAKALGFPAAPLFERK